MTQSFSSDMTSPMNPARSRPKIGNRFNPTDEQLVGHYLVRKLNGIFDEDTDELIPEVKICDLEPQDLPDMLKKEPDDDAFHFFSLRDHKYSGSHRSNRSTKAGFWKPTGKRRNVVRVRGKKVIGTKRSLVYYKKARPKPVRTGWILHEYDIGADSNSGIKGSFLLYKLKAKPDDAINEGEPHHMASPSQTESHTLTVITASSYHDGSELSEPTVDPEKQTANEMIAMSTYDTKVCESAIIESHPSNLLLDEMTTDFGCNASEILSSNVITPLSTCENGMSWEKSLVSKDRSSCGINDQSLEVGGGSNSENQVQCDRSDMSALSVGAGFGIAAAEDTSLERHTIFDELDALVELEDCINSEVLSIEGSLCYSWADSGVSLPGDEGSLSTNERDTSGGTN